MKITIELNVNATGFAQSYTVCETRAPQAYDYHGVIQLEGGDTRIVAIPDEDLPIQTGRYQSGMYHAKPLEFADEATLLDLLISRLIACKCQ